MASLRELRKRLKSIHTTEQLAGAMKTVSAAKFSRIDSVLAGYRPYADSCRSLMLRFGSSLSAYLPCTAPDAPACFVVISSNRGLCGDYNNALLSYADAVIGSHKDAYTLITCGRIAAGYYQDIQHRAFDLPDVPDFSSCLACCDYLRKEYIAGRISSVTLLYQSFHNMLTQEPASYALLPITADTPPSSGEDEMLYLPNKATVLKNACLNCVNAAFFSILLEAAAGAQASTLVAMRAAYDNARDSSARLETVISRKRQSEVTASVIETSADNNGGMTEER